MNKLDKKIIFTPGPVRMYPETLRLGAIQAPYFRNDEFSKIIFECEEILLELLNAPKESKVIFLTASGTAGMEAVVQNLLNANDETLVINGGGFGQRFVDLCQIHGINYKEHRIENTNLADTKPLEAYKRINSLLINGHETTIGMLYDLEAVGNFCQENNILHIVDAISMFITDELDMQKQHIDTLIVSSHKGLALPPGLTMVVLSPKVIEQINPSNSLYFDFKSYLKNGERGQTPFTPAVTIILQLHERLKQIKQDGLVVYINKAKEIAEYFRGQISSLPLQNYSQFMPNAMTSLMPTDGKSANQIVNDLEGQYGIVVAPNGGDLKNIVFRVSHMGNMDKVYVDILINALYDYFNVKREK
jgi:aspartate aminotransferase-like enzyme